MSENPTFLQEEIGTQSRTSGRIYNLDPISDNEEEGNRDEDESEGDQEKPSPTQPTPQGQRAQRKRPRSKTSKVLDDADSGLPLPGMPTEESDTQARSGRIRKKPKVPDGFEIDTL